MQADTDTWNSIPCVNPSTDLGNAAMLEREMTRFIARYRRVRETFSLMIIAAGDPIIPQQGAPDELMSRLLALEVREDDAPCHIEGRWFAVLLAGASHVGARAAFERVRSVSDWAPGRPITRSAVGGVAEWNPGFSHHDEMVAAAMADLLLSWEMSGELMTHAIPPLLMRAIKSDDRPIFSSAPKVTALPRVS